MRVLRAALIISSALLVLGAARANADDDFPPLSQLPDLRDAINEDTLKKEVENPRIYPDYLEYDRQKPGWIALHYDPKETDAVANGDIACDHVILFDSQSDTPLSWSSHDTAASNVFIHVHRALHYFLELEKKVGERIYLESKPVPIRVHMTVAYAIPELYGSMFSNVEEFDTAVTIPEHQIWFYVPKRIYMPKYDIFRYIPVLKNTILGTYGFPNDSAHEPSLIEHEWTHLMTAPYLGLERATLMNEGYSNYFGSVISSYSTGKAEVADVPEYSGFPWHRYYENVFPATEEDNQHPSDFIPSFFWLLRRTFGADKADVLIWKALHYLDSDSKLDSLKSALTQASPSVLDASSQVELRRLLDTYINNF